MNTYTGEIGPLKELKAEAKARDIPVAVRRGMFKRINIENLLPSQRAQLARTGRTYVSRNSRCPCGSGKRFKRCCQTPSDMGSKRED